MREREIMVQVHLDVYIYTLSMVDKGVIQINKFEIYYENAAVYDIQVYCNKSKITSNVN